LQPQQARNLAQAVQDPPQQKEALLVLGWQLLMNLHLSLHGQAAQVQVVVKAVGLPFWVWQTKIPCQSLKKGWQLALLELAHWVAPVPAGKVAGFPLQAH